MRTQIACMHVFPYLKALLFLTKLRHKALTFTSLQVINHGISSSVVRDALDAATQFFDLPVEEKMLLVSANVHKPVRYGTSINHSTDRVHYWRDFIKHYSHPLSKWIDMWPSNPPCYK